MVGNVIKISSVRWERHVPVSGRLWETSAGRVEDETHSTTAGIDGDLVFQLYFCLRAFILMLHH